MIPNPPKLTALEWQVFHTLWRNANRDDVVENIWKISVEAQIAYNKAHPATQKLIAQGLARPLDKHGRTRKLKMFAALQQGRLW